MNVVKCDRCGAITALPTHRYSRILARRVYGSGVMDRHDEFDLCPDCARAFADWMGVDYDARQEEERNW